MPSDESSAHWPETAFFAFPVADEVVSAHRMVDRCLDLGVAVGLGLHPDRGVGGEDDGHTLNDEGFVRRVVAVKTLKGYIAVVAGGLGLVVLAGFLVLTNTVALVITLAILAAVIFASSRLVWAGTEEGRKRTGSR